MVSPARRRARRSRAAVVLVLALALVLPTAAGADHDDRPRPDGLRYAPYKTFTHEKTRVAMRDGVELSVDIWRPDTPAGVKVPVILHLTPYHVLHYALTPGSSPTALPDADARRYVPKGYAYAFADVRGTWGSGGCWDYGGIKERQDGHDLVEWLGTRDWSNGNVAMMGVSYPGTTPNAAAVEQPEHLATIVPISAISRWWGYAYQQGARSTYSGESLDIDPPSDTPLDFMFVYGFVPPPDPSTASSAQQISMRWNLCDRVEQTLHGYSTQPDYDDFWKERDYLRLADRVEVPVLVSHGQLDFNVKTWEGTAWYEALDVPKMLVLGQWAHASPRGRYPQWNRLLDRWFERWLYEVENHVEDEPRVRVQTNDGAWHLQDDWGGEATTTRSFPLAGNPFSFVDDGALTESEMVRGIGAGSRYVRVRVPGTEGGLRFGGRPVLRLSASSDQPSTHFVAVLCDVGSDGACKVVSRAFLNARYRNGLGQGQDLEPAKAYTFPLEFIDKDYVVAPGRHLELIIGSSSTTWVASDERRAVNTLHLGDSVLDLPVYAADQGAE